MQVNRWDGTEDSGGRRLSMWCHPGLKKANPHNPDRFGFVVFQVELRVLESRFRGNDAEGTACISVIPAKTQRKRGHPAGFASSCG